ncbi:TylF/MycF family methyltransferase [bacterium]|nr:TylF/MycF family methyltransferase [bacterium]MDC1211972.1 TylF/MycF family methyltransferase [bacterium]
MGNRIKNLKIKALSIVSDWFSAFPFFIQGRMDIDQKSLWFDDKFNGQFGGYLPASDVKNIPTLGLPLHDNVRKDMLLLLCKSIATRKVEGAIAELGVFQGKTARLFHHYFPNRELYLFDTFSGFDKRDVQSEKNTTGLETTEAHFSNTNMELVRSAIQPVNNNIHFIEGYFPQTWSAALDQMTFALVHLDADLYAPTKAGLEQFYPRLNAGGLVIIHDYNAWFGARTAVDEYCKENALVPIPMPDKSGSCIILKPS